MKQQKGFTLIELIIVIVILGILAVTAAPRFFDFGGDARESTVNGLKAALEGAAQVTFARAAVDEQLGGIGTTNGISLVNGYPDSTSTGIILAASLGGNSEAVPNGAASTEDWVYFEGANTIHLAPGALVTGSGPAVVTDITGTNCFIQYSDAASSNTPPVIAVTTSGCGN